MKLSKITTRIKHWQWRRYLLGLLTFILVIIAGVGGRIWNYNRTIASGKYDCAIVLGAAVDGATPSPVFQARIEHGNLL